MVYFCSFYCYYHSPFELGFSFPFLGWADTFTKYFEKYGEVIDSVIMKDRQTGRPRGFGFITYADPSVVDTVIKEDHIINDKQVISCHSFVLFCCYWSRLNLLFDCWLVELLLLLFANGSVVLLWFVKFSIIYIV